MRSSSPPPVERARPLLGTYVAVRVAGVGAAHAHRAIDAAFAEIATIDARMSFHRADSDVARLNRAAWRRPVRVHPHTAAVLRWALAVARQSGGCFDIAVAPELMARGWLPWRAAGFELGFESRLESGAPDPRGSWRDIELGPDAAVRFHRRLAIDLGGIAKGYAVDRAIERLRALEVPQCCVNAGGDLRVAGPAPERVALRGETLAADSVPVVELRDGSVASSEARPRGPHVDGRRRGAPGRRRFVSVVAPRCVTADALTKVVLMRGRRSAPLLRRHGAVAHLHDTNGWYRIGATS
jgi:thiamine biosynthesis lipoprotein